MKQRNGRLVGSTAEFLNLSPEEAALALSKALQDLRKSKNLTQNDFTKTGIHPVFGAVTLGQLLATWAVHDLNHLSQIARVMAKHYKYEVGPWIEFLGILKT